MTVQTRTTRRAFAAILGIAATFTVAARPLPTSHAKTSTARAALPTPSDHWLLGMTAKHRQFFDSPAPGGGIPLVHILNYYDTLNRVYHAKDADVDAVGTFYGATTFYGLSDAVWAKYRLGEFLDVTDAATGTPAVANPWRAAPVILGLTLPQASIESLQKRGATFILCDNALHIFSSLLAAKRGLDANVVYADLASNILPRVELVPGMVVAVEQAHEARLSYHRQ
jgi:hypothetical protein